MIYYELVFFYMHIRIGFTSVMLSSTKCFFFKSIHYNPFIFLSTIFQNHLEIQYRLSNNLTAITSLASLKFAISYKNTSESYICKLGTQIRKSALTYGQMAFGIPFSDKI